MGHALSGLFGGKPKKPVMVTQPVPIEKINESNVADDAVKKELAKKRRATMLSQQLGDANISNKQLGAGV